MVLIGGRNVYPAEVESALDQHPLVASSCVVGVPHEDLGNVLHAIVQVDAPTSDEELLAHLRERLVSYKLPRTFDRVTEPLRGDDGKVRRSALRSARLAALSSTRRKLPRQLRPTPDSPLPRRSRCPHQDDTARTVRACFEANGLQPTPEEMATYVAMAPMLRQMTEQLHAVEIEEGL